MPRSWQRGLAAKYPIRPVRQPAGSHGDPCPRSCRCGLERGSAWQVSNISGRGGNIFNAGMESYQIPQLMQSPSLPGSKCSLDRSGNVSSAWVDFFLPETTITPADPDTGWVGAKLLPLTS